MVRPNANRELAFTLNDVARLLKTFADQKAREFGMTRAKWAVLARIDRVEGLKQAELAEMLDLQPITLTRLLDGLAKAGLIERRADPHDRRAKRLYLTPKAQPLLDQMTAVGEEVMGAALAGLAPADVAALLSRLAAIKDNLREAIQRKSPAAKAPQAEQRYG